MYFYLNYSYELVSEILSYHSAIGKEERSVLNGVFHFCEVKFGYRWVDLEESVSKYSNTTQTAKKMDIREPILLKRLMTQFTLIC